MKKTKSILGACCAVTLALCASQSAIAEQKGVAGTYRDGNHTIIKCMNGKEHKVYHRRDGKCEMSSAFGSYDCGFAIKDTMKKCE